MAKLHKYLTSILLIFLVFVSCSPVTRLLQDREEVTSYPAYGYLQDSSTWAIPMTIWVHEPRNLMHEAVSNIVAEFNALGEQEEQFLRTRLADLVADSESREAVRFIFRDDPAQEVFFLQDEKGGIRKTDLNGRVDGVLHLKRSRASALLAAQKSTNGRLTFDVISDEHFGSGEIFLVVPRGQSVISDIDDTIKITGFADGFDTVLRKTFFEAFKAAPGMAERYHNLPVDAFHYVSGSPWQLFHPLHEFLITGEGQFPPGSFHMKNVRKNLFSRATWSDIRKLFGGEATVKQKVAQISSIVKHFPQRTFILVGDSGEHDPEIYREVKSRFPNQITEIMIRDVLNDRENNPQRLYGMTIIDARRSQ